MSLAVDYKIWLKQNDLGAKKSKPVVVDKKRKKIGPSIKLALST